VTLGTRAGKRASIAGSGLMGEWNLSICELGHGHD